MKGKVRTWFVLVGVLAWTGWCQSAAGRQITDMAGNIVNVPDVIEKVYGASPPATLMVYALDPGLLAGVNFPVPPSEKPFLDPRMANLPVVGGWFGQGRAANLEILAIAKPDIILVWWWRKSAMDEKICLALSPLDIPIVHLALDSLEDYPAAFEFLGDLFSRKNRAGKLSRYAESVLLAAEKLRENMPAHKKAAVYYAEDANGLSTECHSSMHAQLIQLAGGKNVHQCLQQSLDGRQQITMEQVMAYDPEVIVSHDARFLSRVTKDPRWRQIRAVKDHRVYEIPSRPFNWFDRPPSFMRLLGLSWMMSRLYPDAYPVVPEKTTREFFALFLGVDLDDGTAGKLWQP